MFYNIDLTCWFSIYKQLRNFSSVKSIKEAKKVLKFVVELYNNERPHMSIGNLYPSVVHQENIKTERLWKKYYQKNSIFVNQFQD